MRNHKPQRTSLPRLRNSQDQSWGSTHTEQHVFVSANAQRAPLKVARFTSGGRGRDLDTPIESRVMCPSFPRPLPPRLSAPGAHSRAQTCRIAFCITLTAVRQRHVDKLHARSARGRGKRGHMHDKGRSSGKSGINRMPMRTATRIGGGHARNPTQPPLWPGAVCARWDVDASESHMRREPATEGGAGQSCARAEH